MSAPKKVDVAAAVLLRGDGRVLLGQRAPDTFYPGYWEFPGGKVEAGESPRDALVRELSEELGVEVTAATPWLSRSHAYEHAHVTLHFFIVRGWRGELNDHVHSALSWEDPHAMAVSPMLPANGPILKSLRLPTILAECEKVAARCASDNVDHLAFLLQLCALELLERERRGVRRIVG